ncbi:MAG: PadR family transcriptional regulator [Anaerolineae bacterium]
MPKKDQRELTPLEYVVLGLISTAPQSGYDIINQLSPVGVSSWSASPGAIYPILKRLETQGIIVGTVENEHEMRPRKLYTLSKAGNMMLDEWLRQVPKMLPLYEQREMALWRFQFMEGRLPLLDILRWIDTYIDALSIYDYGRKVVHYATLEAMSEAGQDSVHKQLLLEITLMEVSTLRTWLELARARLSAVGRATGEFKAAKPDES